MIPPPIQPQHETPADEYLVTKELEAAVHIAKTLGRPLLLTGEPGVGKSSLAPYLAAKYQWPYKKFVVKSDTKASDFFYYYDSIGRFSNAQDPNSALEAASFLRFNALGWALLCTYRQQELNPLSDLVDQPLGHDPSSEQVPNCVVLIDEIDKAPRDVPNDLLDEFDHFAFSVNELRASRYGDGNKFEFQAQYQQQVKGGNAGQIKPLLIITSNDERGLPDAFLRRCIFHHIPVPPLAQGNADDPQVTLDDILILQAGQQWCQSNGQLYEPFSKFFQNLKQLPLKKPPSVSEMIWFLQAFGDIKFDGLKLVKTDFYNPQSAESLNPRQLSIQLRQGALYTLFKSAQDQVTAAKCVDDFVKDAVNSHG